MSDWAEEIAHETAMSMPPSDFGSFRAVKAFAAALRAERERCAQIAETWPDAPFAKHGQWHGTLRKSIVYAIRTHPHSSQIAVSTADHAQTEPAARSGEKSAATNPKGDA